MPNPATTQDVVNRWRPLSDTEVVNAQTFLDDAWRMLKRGRDDLAPRMADDEELTAEVVRILSQAVVRVLKNPDGKRQEAIDDYSWTRDQAVSAGLLYFTDDELRAIEDEETSTTGRAYSIDLVQSTYSTDGLEMRPDLWLQWRWPVQ